VLELKQTTQFKRDLRRMVKRNVNIMLLDEVVELLINEKPLPAKYRNHSLSGDLKGFRDCHVQPNWVFIYMIDDKTKVLTATRTGTHSEVFRK
jgi:mRNA interferase YafQ